MSSTLYPPFSANILPHVNVTYIRLLVNFGDPRVRLTNPCCSSLVHIHKKMLTAHVPRAKHKNVNKIYFKTVISLKYL